MTPEGGFGTYGQQPSLDAIIRKIQQQLQSFNFKGAPIFILLPIAVVAISLWTAWFTVQPAETGIVQRFGKVVRTAGPGLHFKVPLGIETVRTLPTARVLKEEFGFRTLATGAGQRTQYAADNKSFKS